MRLERLRSVDVVLGVGRRKPDAGGKRREVAHRVAADLDHERQAERCCRFVDRAVAGMPEGLAQPVRAQGDRDDLRMLAQADGFPPGGLVRLPGADQQLPEQARVALEPVLDRPVVGRADRLDGEVGLGGTPW